MQQKFKNDIAIIGIGRVGLPLAVSFASVGYKTIGVDIDIDLINTVNKKIFPFKEPGYKELIQKTELFCTTEVEETYHCENLIVTVGTPLLGHIETDLSHVQRVITSLIPHLRSGHNLILRSTIAPNTTNFVKNFLEQKTNYKVGKDIFLSFCPERIVEGRAMIELHSLPQIIGSEDAESARKAEEIFLKLTKEVLHTNFISAELVKLFNNISRYVHFSIANQFTIIADNFGADIYDIIHMTNYKYPRGMIPQPGLTAGTCLRKDFGMINEAIPYTDLLLSAWKVNEFIPRFLVDNMKKRTALLNKKVAVLGFTFKKNVDDIRDSLVPKMVRYIERENPSGIFIHDPFLPETIDNLYKNFSLDEAILDADVVYLAINHFSIRNKLPEIFNKCRKEAWFADIWNISKQRKIFYQNPSGSTL